MISTNWFQGALFLIGKLAVVSAFAGNTPDLKTLVYQAKKLNGPEFKVQFSPPKDHHFNMEAPSKIQFSEGESSNKGQLEKKTSEFIGTWQEAKGKNPSKCEIKTEFYLCDDKNSYCVPVKQTFTCDDFNKKSATAGQLTPQENSASLKTKAEQPAEKTSLFLVNEPKLAFEKAQAEKKMVLIDFFGIWCPPCNMLDENVFNRNDFKKMQTDYVLLKMDADQSVSFDLKSKYNIKGYPSIVLANAQGDEIARIVGYRKAKAFIAEMKQALAFKNTSVADRIKKAESAKFPDIAFGLAKMYSQQEDHVNTVKFSMLAIKSKLPNQEQRQILSTAQIKLIAASAKDEASQKKAAQLIEDSLALDPTGTAALESAETLAKIGEDLKDEALQNRAMNSKFKNISFLLQNPKQLLESEFTEGDLYSIQGDIYETIKDSTKSKESFLKAAHAYEAEIKASGQSIDTERGYNLERIYCLHKAGFSEEALSLYGKLELKYPEEFTFYYSHANVLKELGKKAEALEKAEKAMTYSYGDNHLRVVHLTAELRSQQGKKAEALRLIDETLEKLPEPQKDLKVRTSRYIEKLNKLKDQIKRM